ncbi:Adhesion G-protein coupled receptor G7 [Manis javanica]|nr:Adhesion G-protein coupled receptor G7 [Manis javanica]
MPMSHTVLIATSCNTSSQKDAALTVLDTHAGAGLYRLDGDYANKSGESADGIKVPGPAKGPLAPVLQAYLATVRSFNQGAAAQLPGLALHHPVPAARAERDGAQGLRAASHRHALAGGQHCPAQRGRQVAVLHEDGFEGIKRIPATTVAPRPGAVRPQHEPATKSDYAKVLDMAADSLALCHRHVCGLVSDHPAPRGTIRHAAEDHDHQGRQELAARSSRSRATRRRSAQACRPAACS